MAVAPVHDLSVIPSAPFDDLDLDREGDEQEWERRAMALAATRIDAARARLQRLGVINVPQRRPDRKTRAASRFQIGVSDLAHLPSRPHEEALRWRWDA